MRLGIIVGLSLSSVAFVLGGCADEGGRNGAASGYPGLTGLGGGTKGDDPEGGSADTAGNGFDDGDTADDDDADGNDDAPGPKFDIGDGAADEGMVEDTCGTECECVTPDHVACDAAGSDLFNAIGLNCPGEPQVTVSVSGPVTAMGVRTGFGNTNTWAPTEGSKFAVIGSGFISDLDLVTPNGDDDDDPTHCNDDLGGFDPGGTLPAPLRTNDVGGVDCAADPTLIGTGDCSNTIASQFSQGSSANDYVEMRAEIDVPDDVISVSYDFAFFTTEWPNYANTGFNDMYVGWLESENWTGNISFDAAGNPISLNAGFLEYTDGGGSIPEFASTCMRQHAGTGWLSTTVGVTPGEHITMVFSIFDLSDSILDSYAFIDNFVFGCDPQIGPTTQPEG